MSSIMSSLRAPLADFTDARLNGCKRIDYQNDDTGLPKSDVLSFALSADDQFIVRPSGTEPKLKAYLFTRASSVAKAEANLDRLQELVYSLCK